MPLIETGHDDLDAIAAIQSFHPMVEALARARGYTVAVSILIKPHSVVLPVPPLASVFLQWTSRH